jgi:hypothetical protein
MRILLTTKDEEEARLTTELSLCSAFLVVEDFSMKNQL